jgi:hypothetical protein
MCAEVIGSNSRFDLRPVFGQEFIDAFRLRTIVWAIMHNPLSPAKVFQAPWGDAQKRRRVLQIEVGFLRRRSFEDYNPLLDFNHKTGA